jgi:hypothetical protein
VSTKPIIRTEMIQIRPECRTITAMPRLTLALIALLFVSLAQAEDRLITCDAPTKNTDGSALLDLSGFKLYGGLQGQAQRYLATASVCRFERKNLATGVQLWYVTAYSPAGESEPSAITSYTVTGTTPPTCPAQPALTQPQTCVAPTIGSWTQSRTVTSVAAPACWEAGPWTPDVAPAGVCASPPPALVTSSTQAFELRGTATAPTLSFVGIVQLGRPCGPEIQVVQGLKYCRVPVWRADGALQAALTNSPLDFKVTGVWVRTSP